MIEKMTVEEEVSYHRDMRRGFQRIKGLKRPLQTWTWLRGCPYDDYVARVTKAGKYSVKHGGKP